MFFGALDVRRTGNPLRFSQSKAFSPSGGNRTERTTDLFHFVDSLANQRVVRQEPVSESGRSRLRGNTESLEIDASEAGYLAGYAAVQAGYTHLGYIGQKNEENGTKYGTGYALGAEAAAADLGLGENSITLDYTYRKSSSVSPSYLEKIKSWYGESGQILFSDGASYQNVLGAAASAAGGALIANGGVEEYANAVLKKQTKALNCESA